MPKQKTEGEGGTFYISDICGISGTITHILRNAQNNGNYGPTDIADVADLITGYHDDPGAYNDSDALQVTVTGN